LTASFFSLVQDSITSVEALIKSQADGNDPDLASAINLLVSSGGKRIRPTVTLLVGNMLGASEIKLVTVAAAIEMLHTATLVHDDLIDGSLLRRGNPTLNSLWTPGATVLTGDFMFARAAKLASDAESIPVMKAFSQALTVIVNGEITQLFTSRCDVDREAYFRRIYAKTASLFETAAITAAHISNVEANVIEDLRQYGYGIGVAFQIIDDVLDFTAEESMIGKPVGSDLKQGIITLPTLNFISMYPDNAISVELVAGRCLNDEQASRLVDEVRNSKAIANSLEEACRYVKDGLQGLKSQPDGKYKRGLQDLAEYIVNRKK
jgi:geranylgeranyl pyrophosphate synthase